MYRIDIFISSCHAHIVDAEVWLKQHTQGEVREICERSCSLGSKDCQSMKQMMTVCLALLWPGLVWQPLKQQVVWHCVLQALECNWL